MCLIISKPKGVKLDDEFFRLLKSGWAGNGDGGGLAKRVKNSGTIFVAKGFVNFEDMAERIEKLKVNKDDELIVHMRIRTHGTISPENTHPFIIKNEGKMIDNIKEESFTKAVAFFHNGMISGFRESKVLEEKDWSDTRLYAKYVLANTIKNKEEAITGANLLYLIKRDQHQSSKEFNEAINPIVGHQKFAFLSTQYGLLLVGDHYQNTKGYFLSNKYSIR
jgi:predicted glutamine amidotransferase